MRQSSSKINISNVVFVSWEPDGAELSPILFFFQPGDDFLGRDFFRMTAYFLKSPVSGFLGFSGLEILHATILVKNQYVEPLFRLLRARWGVSYD